MKKKQQTKNRQASAIFEELEPRLLFSAGVEGLIAGNLHVQGVTEFVVDDNLQLLRAANEQQADKTGADNAVDNSMLELVFIDAATPDKEQLLNDLLNSDGAGNRQFAVFELAANSDGVLQISATLENYQNVAAIHIVSHGSDAEVRLGNTALNAGNFASYQDTLRSWTQSLDVNADILVYGCDLAASAAGQDLIDRLSALTGADIAASTDVTGNVSLGGDWELEYNQGQINTQIAFSAQLQQSWQGTLNTAPSLNGVNNLTSINEDPVSNPGTLVSALIAGHVTDPDAGAESGIAVTAVDNSNGTWEYTVDGGSNWLAFGTPDTSAARLLAADADTSVRFVPDADWNGTVGNGLTFHAWDQSSGTAGGTASLTSTMRDEFTSVSYSNNDGTVSWAGDWFESNDTGGASFDNVLVTGGELRLDNSDSNSYEMVARAADLSTFDTATLSFDFRTGSGVDITDSVIVEISDDAGATWTTLEDLTNISGSSSDSRSYDISAYATADTQIRFRLNNDYTNTSEYFYVDNVQIEAPSTGGDTAFSTATASSSVTVTAIQDAPTGSVTIDNTTPTQGDMLTADNTLADADGLGAISYQWRRDGLDIAGATASTYTLTIDDANTAITVVASYTDGDGTNESVSSAATAAVLETNVAPVLAGANNLTTIDEDDVGNSGTLVSALISGQISDSNTGSVDGIAVIGVDNSNGTWEYTVDGGSNWLAFGTPSESAARLLTDDANTSVRFVPDADWNGTVSNGLTFHAWDQSSGTAGATADLIGTHTYTDQFSTAVYSNNDGSHAWSTDWIETDSGGATSGDIDITGGRLAVYTDSTSDNIYREVDLTGATGATLTLDFDNRIDTSDKNDRVRLQISGDGGATYTNLADFDYNTNTSNFGSLSFDISGYISGDTRVRFAVTNTDSDRHYVYFDNVEITATGYPSTGGDTAFSDATASSSVTVNAVNDEQTLTTNTGFSVLLGNSGVITQAMLETTDIDNTAAQLVYTLDVEPANGTVLLSGTPLVASSTFTQADINAGLVTYQHDGSATTSDSFDLSVDDGQGSASSATVNVTVTEINAAPVLGGANDLPTIDEDDFSNSGTLVSTLIAGHSSDSNVLSTDRGIAVTAVDNSNGSWEYTTDGGSNWLAFGTPSESDARLLGDDANTSVRFVPNADWNGTVGNGLTFHAWDQSSGTAGGTASLTSTMRDEFTSVSYSNNDGTVSWAGDWFESNDTGGASFDNVLVTGGELRLDNSDSNSYEMVARAADLSTFDTATLSFDFRTGSGVDITDSVIVEISDDAGATWTTLEDLTNISGSSSDSRSYDISAYATADTQIRFRLNNDYTNTSEYFYVDNVQIEAPSTGGDTAFSTATASSSVTVTAIQDAPTGSVTIDNTTPTQGDMLTADNTLADADGLGAISYQWRRDGLDIAGATASTYTLTIDDANTAITVVASYTDGDGTNESVSSAATAAVLETNVAPVLAGANNLTTIDEDDVGNSGTLVSALISGQISDSNTGSVDGIAVIGVDNSNGTWEYTVDGGSNWLAFGTPSESAARLLTDDANTSVRFVPDADWNGTVSNGLTFHAWDQSSGTAGATADLIGTHTYTDQFSTAVYSNNDGSHAWSTDWIETDSGGATSGDIDITGGRLAVYTDSTSDNIYREVDLTGATGATLTLDFDNRIDTSDKNDRVRLQISGDGGATYTNLADFDYNTNTSNFGSLSFDISGYISGDTRVRFAVTNTDSDRHYVYFDNVEITATGYPSTGGDTAFSTATASSSITVTPVDETPQVANITTDEDTQSGLIVIDRNANDGAEVTHFRLSGISNGALFQADGATAISDGDYITFAQAQAGLRFTPGANSTAAGSFSVESSEDGSTVAALSGAATSTITVTPVGDTPQVANITTDEDTQSGAIVIDRHASDGAEVTHFRISGISNGALFQADGATAINNGDYITFAQAQAGLRFTPTTNSTANGLFSVESSEDGSTVAAQSAAATSTITVTAVGDTPQVADSTTDEDTQSGLIVIDRHADDGAEVTHFRISGISNGALFQADGATAISNGDYITFAQAQDGLRFTPTTNSTANGLFSVESSEDGSTVAAQSAAATSTITVTAVGDTPQVANITTDEDTQSGLIVIDRHANDGAEVTHFRLSGISNGALFQADGATAISNGDYITFAQAQAGLRFTPGANSTAAGSFSVEASEDGSTVAAQSGAATSTITVTPVGDTPQVADSTTDEDTQSGLIVIDRHADDGAEVTHFRLSGISNGALFQADGATAISNGDYITFAQAQAGLRFTPGANSTAAGSFSVEASEDGSTVAAQSGAATSTITVTAVGDTPQVADSTTDEDTQSGLIVIDRHADDGAEVTHFRISGISNGALFQADGATAISNGDYITFAQAQAGLRFTPGADSTADGSFSVESSEDGSTVAAQSGAATSTITVTPVGDTPQVADSTTDEDTQSGLIVIDRHADDGAEVTHFRISGISNGALFQADGATAISNGDYITFAQAQAGLRFTPNANSTAAGSFSVESSEDGSTVAAQSAAATSTITVTAVGDTPQVANITTDEDTQSGLIVIDRHADDGAEVTHFRISGISNGALFQADGATAISNGDYITFAQAQAGLRFTPGANSTAAGSFSVESSEDGSTVAAQSGAATSTITVTPVGDTPQVANITTDEDTQSGAIVIDRHADDGAEVTHFRISGISNGALFQADGATAISNGDYITFAQAQAGLRFTPGANSTAAGSFSVEASEDGSTVATQSGAATSTITVTPVGDTPQVANITTDEDTQSGLIVIDRHASDGAEVTHFRLSGISNGALFQADGATAINNGDYITFAQAQAGLRFTPTTNSTANGGFSVEASEDGSTVAAQSAAATSTITVTAVGDTPQVANITTDEDTQSGLIVIDRHADDGAEVTHFRLSGISNGALFQADGATAISNGDYITFAQAQAGLRFTPGADSTANGGFSVEASEDGSTVAAQSGAATSTITVTAVGDTPQVADSTTDEDTQSGLIVIDRHADDGAEVTHFRLSGISNGALFQADGATAINNGDYITFAQAQAGLRFTPGANSTAAGSFSVESSEDGSTVAAQSGAATSTITVTAVGDTPQVADSTTDEDTQSGLIVIDRHADDGAEVTHFRISGISNGALFQADGATAISNGDYITFAQAQAGLRFTPNANSTAAGSFSVESSEDGSTVAAQSAAATSTITVTAVGDTPQVADSTTDEDTQSGLIVIDRHADDGAEVTHFRISGISNGALFQADGATAISNGDYITFAQAQAGLRFTPNANSTAAGSFSVESSEDGSTVAAQSAAATSTITVTPVGDTPQVANITTDEDTQSGLIVIDRHADDGAEVTHFRISGISNGALFQADGATAISNGDYITFAQAQAGLRFTPGANSTAAGSFSVEASEDGSTVAAQSGAATSTITVTAVGDTPQVADSTTDEDTQSGLIVIDRHADDGAEVTHFRISGISNGALFQADGATAISNGDYITFAQAQAGVRFTPSADSTANGLFSVESSEDGSTVAAQSAAATSTITVTAVGDTPQVANITTDEDTQSGLIVIDRHASDGAEVTHFRLSGISNGALFQADGATAISNGDYITFAQAQAGLRFTPNANSTAAGSFSVESSEDGSTVAAQSGAATSTITVTPVGDTPQVANSTTDEDTQSGLIVIDRHADDGAEVTHFRISGISNGALFQADGATAISNGDYITFAQAQDGLRFTPTTNSTANGLFSVESSEDGSTVAAQSAAATSTITVTPVGDTPQVANITTDEDTQSGLIVIDRHADDGAEVTHFRISGIGNGALFQADGATAISNGDYITFAQAQAGLRFTPSADSTANGGFSVEASEDGSTVAAQSAAATSTITVTPVGDTPQVANITTDEDTQSGLIVIDRHADDGAEVTHFRISGISNGALFQADGATAISNGDYITFAQAQAGLRFTPGANSTAAGSFSVEASEDGSTVAAQSGAATSTITVTAVGDTPQVADSTTDEDTQSGLIVIDRHADDGAEVTHFRISGISNGALFQADGATAISNGDYITFAQAQAGLRFTPNANSTAAGSFSVESSEDGSTVAAQSAAATSTITVTAVGDTPQVANITTDEDTQSGLIVIDRHADDGAEVTHFRISGISNGALFQADGATAISNGDYITFAQAQAGLRFTPGANSTAAGSFSVESSEDGSTVAAQSAAATSTITVTAVGDTPQVANITTDEDTQSGLIVIDRHADDGAEVTHFRISGISNGALFQADGATAISNGDYITFAQAQAGLRFTPGANSTAAGSFSVESSEDGSTVAAQSAVATSTITVTAVGDTPQVANITTDEDTQSGLIVIDRHASDGAEVTHFRLSGISNGALFQADGATAISNGDYITFAQAQAGLRFTPTTNSTANGLFSVESSEDGSTVAAQSAAATSTITVTAVGDTPQVADSTTDEDTQSGLIVIDRHADDGAEVTHFRISGISNGALFQADGATAISNGDYITFAQAQDGLRFTPTTNSTANGLFSVESSEDGSTVAAQSAAATSTITVTPVGDTPQVANITTDEDTQSGLIVIDRHADDGAEVTHFRISGIGNGALFQADGATAISNGDYITFAQAQAGLRFTPSADSTANGGFSVEASEDGSTVAAQSGAATSTITVTPVGDTPQVANITTDEDTQSGLIVIDRHASDGAEVTHFRISGIGNGALFQADGATAISNGDYITFAQAQAGLRFTPSADSTANGGFSVEASEDGSTVAAQSGAATSTITVTAVGDTPQVANITTDEDTQSGLIVIDRHADDGAEVTHFRISGISNGALFQADGATAISNGDYITFAQAQAGLRFTPGANSTAAGSFSVESSEDGSTVAAQSAVATSTITVTAVGDTPQVANITTDEDTQSGLIVIDRHADDGAEVTHFRISGISNGALFQADGATAISNGDYITFAQAQAGLRFTPGANSTAAGSFSVESSEDGSTVAAQSAVATSTITVTAVGDTPQVANITTDEDTQSGLIVIDRHASDGAEVTHFRLSGISNGALFQADGATAISNGDYITFAQAQAGLRFTPTTNSTANGLFSVESSEDGSTVAAQSAAATSTITVTAVGDTPQVADSTTDEDTQSGLIVIDRHADDGAEVTHFRISGISNGALFQADGATAISNGDYITFAQAQDGLRFTPTTNSTANGLFSVESSEDGSTVAAQSAAATSTITVTPVGDTPQVANITTDEDTQSGLIVIDRHADDGAEVTHFRISGIGNGALFQADGATAISNGDYITFAQAQAGLRFTPSADSTANGGFSVEASEDGSTVAAQSGAATSTITVTPVGDTPQVANITTDEDTQSGLIVIDRHASDGAEVTHFRISGIGNGALFQADGATAISNGDYITFAQAQAGLRFTPSADSTANGGFSVEASEDGSTVAAQSGAATSTITVTAVGDTPQVADSTTDEDTQSGLIVIDRHADDGAEVTHFRISGISNGALFQADGATAISNGDYITFAQAQAGLRFTPNANSTAAGSFSVESSKDGSTVAAQSGAATSTITVTAVGDTPQVADSTTDEDTQSGLIVIDRHADDGAEVTHFRLSGISNGALFQADGATAINNGDYITFAQAQAGLRFTPGANSTAAGSFSVESSEDGSTVAAQSGAATSTITVTAVGDTPQVADSTTDEDTQSGLIVIDRHADDGAEVTHFRISGISNGALFQADGATAISNGDYITFAQAQAGLRFTPNANSTAAGSFSVESSEDGSTVAAQSAAATSTITVTAVGDTPQVADSTTDEDTQSGLIVIDRHADDGAEVTHFRISGISNGALFQADGATAINNGDYITFAQAQAGLRFTPTTNSTANGGFSVEASEDGSTVAAQSAVATSTITVTAVGDTPQVANITTDEDTQSGLIVIDRHASDGAEVTHFRISGISNGALFQADGATAISNGDYITFAQAQAGLRFTPTTNSTANGGFSVEASEDGSTVAAQSGVATSTITVTAVGDTPQVANITTDEDTQSGLIVIDRHANDGAEVTHFRLSGISNGALFQADGATAINNGDYITFAQAQAGLRFTPGANSTAAGSFSVESSEDGSTVAAQSGAATSTITVTAVGDTPQVADSTTDEDTQSGLIVIDRHADDGAEVTHFRISGISNGALFQADGATAISNGDYITFAQAQAGLRFTPNANSTAAGSFSVESSEDGSTVAAQSAAATSTITVTAVGDTPQVADSTTDEDTQSGLIVIDRHADDGAEVTHFRISGISNGALFQADGATAINNGDYITFAQAQAGLRFTPTTNSTANGGFSVEASEDGSTVAAQSAVATSTITVTAVGDTPQVADSTTDEDTQSGLIVIDRHASDGAEVTHFRLSGISNGALFQADGATAISNGDYITFAQAQAGLRFTPTTNSTANGLFSVESSEDGSTVAAQSAVATSTITVTPVGDTPQVANITTDEDTQSGLIVIDRHADDGAEVTHFRISGISNGALFQADGATAISNGDYITFAQAQAGLRFTPTTNSTANGLFSVESSEDGSTVAAQSGAATSTIVITAVNDSPVLHNNRLTVNEGEIIILTGSDLSAIDPDNTGNEITFTVSAVENGQFERVSDGSVITSFTQADIATGGIRFVHNGSEIAPAYQVTVSDGALSEGPSTAAITFSAHANDAPVLVDQVFVVDENSSNGISVGIVAFGDADPADNHTFRITGGSGGAAFAIDSSTGEITVTDSSLLDFEKNPSLTLAVEVTDDGVPALSTSATITITLNDIAEFDISLVDDVDSTTNLIDVNAAIGAPVGITAHAADANPTDTVTYSLEDDADGLFAIDSATGIITLNGALDSQTAQSYVVVVRAASSDGSISTQAFELAIYDSNNKYVNGNAVDTSTGNEPDADTVGVPNGPNTEPSFSVETRSPSGATKNPLATPANNEPDPYDRRRTGNAGANEPTETVVEITDEQIEQAVAELADQLLIPIEYAVTVDQQAIEVDLKKPNFQQDAEHKPASAVDSVALSSVLADHALWEQLEIMRQEMSGSPAEAENHLIDQIVAGSTVALSAGFVSWVLRGGSLLASLLSSLPLWKGFDPLPILATKEKESKRLPTAATDRDVEEQDNLDALFQTENGNSPNETGTCS